MSGVSDPWSGNSQLRNAGNRIIGLVQVVGSIMAVGTLMLVGIKYVISSPDDRANIKSRAIPYVIGAIIIFAAVNIAGIIATFTSQSIK